MFYEIGVLKNFVKFTRKYLYQSLIFDKVPLTKMRIKRMCFHMKFRKFLRTTFSCNTSAGFLLNVAKLKENNKYNYKLNGKQSKTVTRNYSNCYLLYTRKKKYKCDMLDLVSWVALEQEFEQRHCY